MKKRILLIPACLFSLLSNAQTIERAVISSGGAYIEQGLHTLSYSVGQLSTETVTSSNNILTQGFQQPEDFFTAIHEVKTNDRLITVYPNPVTSEIHVGIKSQSIPEFRLEVMDIMGKLVMGEMKVYSNTENVIDLSMLVPGSYIIRVTDERETRVIKFLKN